MNLKEYTASVINKQIDYDGGYGHQCVDLVKHYSDKYLGYTLGYFGGSAKSSWLNKYNTFPEKYFEKIPHTYGDDNIPLPGDIILIDTNVYWHIAIVLKATNTYVEVLEQNVGSGNGIGYDDRVKIGVHNYLKVKGWYRFKGFEKSLDESVQFAIDLGLMNNENLDKPMIKQDIARVCTRLYKKITQK